MSTAAARSRWNDITRGAEPSSMRIPQVAALWEWVPMVSDVSPALLRQPEQGARGGKPGKVSRGEIARPRTPAPLRQDSEEIASAARQLMSIHAPLVESANAMWAPSVSNPFVCLGFRPGGQVL